jgi:hypothetical protein
VVRDGVDPSTSGFQTHRGCRATSHWVPFPGDCETFWDVLRRSGFAQRTRPWRVRGTWRAPRELALLVIGRHSVVGLSVGFRTLASALLRLCRCHRLS